MKSVTPKTVLRLLVAELLIAAFWWLVVSSHDVVMLIGILVAGAIAVLGEERRGDKGKCLPSLRRR